MANTPRLTIPYPAATDIPDGAAQMQAIAQRLDAIAAMYVQGTLATRPAAGTQGRLYLATDSGELFIDNGTQWIAMTPQTSARVADYGDMKYSSRTAEHSGWIFPDGRALAAGVFANLRARLVADGNPYGVSGSDPRIPDLRGRVPLGAGAGAGLTARSVGQSGGAETHALTVAEMPSHTHRPPAGQVWMNVNQPPVFPAGTGAQGLIGDYSATEPTGGNGAHPNMQPYLVGQWFIFAGS